MSAEQTLSSTARKNIDTIVAVEQKLLRSVSKVERIGSTIARYFGSLRFIVAHLILIGVWVVWNAGLIHRAVIFDPFPFPFLSLVISIEFFFLTTFVLMNQSHQARRTEQWGHLNLQLSMLSEQEITKSMQMLQLICERLHMDDASQDEQVQELVQETPVVAIAEEIGKALEVAESLAAEAVEAVQVEQELAEEIKEAKHVEEELKEVIEGAKHADAEKVVAAA